ncbi:MAG: hypothetical protein HYV63_12505 [Candidatus Schekmanbacteria bacterium]|nr:hypothetical protein [Candidatus Schekmanbacteria bacterium]
MTSLPNCCLDSIATAHFALDSSKAVGALSAFPAEKTNRSPEEIAADLSGIELELKNLLNRLGTEIAAALLARLDLRANGVIVGEQAYRRRREDGATEIMSTFGPTAITYALYEERGGHGGKTIAPLLMRIGLVNDFWTPRAAEVGALFVQATTPAESHRLLAAASGMTASPSSLDRLPKSIGEVVEKDRENLEASIRAAETLPAPSCVATIAVSLDGVMVPLKDAKPQSASGRGSEHAQGYREAGCGTISLYDRKGDRLHTIRLARMPEARKVTLHAQLQAELAAIRQRRRKLANSARNLRQVGNRARRGNHRWLIMESGELARVE